MTSYDWEDEDLEYGEVRIDGRKWQTNPAPAWPDAIWLNTLDPRAFIDITEADA